MVRWRRATLESYFRSRPGRPFTSWEECAINALVHCAPCAARNIDWSIGGTLTKLEEYNGLGYAARRTPSPYIWSSTDQYKSGKYVRDGVFHQVRLSTVPASLSLGWPHTLILAQIHRTLRSDLKSSGLADSTSQPGGFAPPGLFAFLARDACGIVMGLCVGGAAGRAPL